ncbi:Protein FAR1-RELATED SEQUENCE 3 [Linum grandiflorum]
MPKDESGYIYFHLSEKALKNPSFYFEMKLDVEEHVAAIFWCDRDMQGNYHCFGDAIYFDTTYRLDKSYRPMALFAGMNHHRQLCVFGAALLYDETAETFEWLFKTFLRYMSGKQPVSLFTDQCDAVASGIKSAFPKTFHALCPYRITEAAKKNLGNLCDTKFLKELVYLMEDVCHEAEHNSKWTKMVEKYVSGKSSTAAGKKWLELMHGLRKQWSSVWVCNHFTAGMHNGEFGKTCYTMLRGRGLLQPELSVEEFVTRFDIMVEGQKVVEKLSDLVADDKESSVETMLKVIKEFEAMIA